jgi:hypothetical protein
VCAIREDTITALVDGPPGHPGADDRLSSEPTPSAAPSGEVLAGKIPHLGRPALSTCSVFSDVHGDVHARHQG